ncbi:MAG: DNA-3-methyladenine glycosylase I [bacterium]|nr:DNA-3-methyladenine glycosylase I [bacterium]
MSNDCCQWAQSNPYLRKYHDEEYGVPIHNDNQLFERLVLEQMQAGLSWLIVLKKRDALVQAFHEFEIEKVAKYDDNDIQRLLANEGIIRNRRKIAAAISNAVILADWHRTRNTFDAWLRERSRRNLDLPAWVKEFRAVFAFTGTEIVKEFLYSIGIFSIEHEPQCFLAKVRNHPVFDSEE